MRVIFTCGGSAGHVNPALAVAEQFQIHHPGCEILFIGAEQGIEANLINKAGYPIRKVAVSTFERKLNWKGIKHNFSTAVQVVKGRRQAREILKEFKPDLVVGTGGYASYPAVREAARQKIPTAIHESNAVPGLTTRTLASKVDLVMVGFPEAAAAYQGTAKRVEVTGTPVRKDFFQLDRESARVTLGIADNTPLVVGFWGSLGAGLMSLCSVDFLARWVHEGRRFHYIHSAGRDYDDMIGQLAEKGVTLEEGVLLPYIHNMPTVMAAADLVICRAGASTIGELTALGKAALLVPSPYVPANHQFKNAKVLEGRGGAVILEERDCTGDLLYDTCLELLADGSRRAAMGKALKELASPHAAEEIYRQLMTLLQG